MNVVLIGGTGNISADCAATLVAMGHRVFAITRGRSPVPEGVTPLIADRKNTAQLSSILTGIEIDSVIDFLGFTPEDMQINVEVFAGRTNQLIFISSATVYAKPHSSLPITEAHPVGNPFSEYARNKQACEDFLTGQDALPVTIVRPSHTYSKRWVPNTVRSAGYTFVDRLERGLPVFVPGKGDTPWTLTSTTDFAKGLCGLVGQQESIGETFHITSDEHPTWKEIYLLTASIAGAKNPDIAEVPADFICEHFPELTQGIKGDKCEPAIFDNSKIKSFVPEFVCTKLISEGIKESIEWMRAHPEDKHISASTHATFDKVVSAWRLHNAS